MVLVVKCLICHKELEYSQEDPSELKRHLQIEHPSLNKSAREVDKKQEVTKIRRADKAVGVNFVEISNSIRRPLKNQSCQTEIAMNNFQNKSDGKMNKILINFIKLKAEK